MKRVLKSFSVALVIYLIIISASFLISLTIESYKTEDFERVYITSFFILFTPIFLSIYFFKENKKWSFYLKSPILAYLIVYFIIYFYFKCMHFRENYNFLELSTFMNATISFFMGLFTNFILIIKSKGNKEKAKSSLKLKHSNKVLLFIPLSATLIYLFLISIGSSSILKAISVITNLLPIGVIISFISFNYFNFLYKKNNGVSNLFQIVFFYVISILICLLISNASLFLNLSLGLNKENSYKNIVITFVIIGPYFLYIISLIHIYYLQLLSKASNLYLKQQTLESQLNYQQLKNQLSPHFLFNNINVLTSLIEENPKKAVTFSENLSHIYRYFLEQEKQDVVLVKDEVEFAKSYLELLKDRFEVGFHFSISIENKSKEKYIVSTILQQVLENVIKHNIIDEDNIVNVEISSTDNYLIIKNNKIPKDQLGNLSKKGIENIKNRVAFFTDEKVIIKNNKENFIIQLPIIEEV